MSFIEFNDRNLIIDDNDSDVKRIVEAFLSGNEKNFDHLPIACGVSPSPDFGYFELADRFWRASLCIYFSGATDCFIERGAGYSEPWLFISRHSIELYIKGFVLNTIWLEELQQNPHLPINKEVFVNLHNELGKPHKLLSLYNEKYLSRIQNVIFNWNTDELPEKPDINFLVLKTEELEILKEFDEADELSFRFRYPSLNQSGIHTIQKIGWKHDTSKLYPISGLPKEAGYFFDHVKVMNNLYKLIMEIKAIELYYKGISFFQDMMNEFWQEQLREFGGSYS
jgi:hypothetical protein